MRQVNPQLHRDAVNVIDDLRNRLPNLNEGASGNGDATTRRRNRDNADITCPICLSDSNLPIETNCGHIFCG